MTMLTKLDPTAEAWTDPTHELDPDLLPTYTQYKAVTAQLPGTYMVAILCTVPLRCGYLFAGGYYYLHIFAPRPEGETTKYGKEEVRNKQNLLIL